MFQDEIIDTLDVVDGYISFQGSGSLGTGPIGLQVDNVDVAPGSYLSLMHGFLDRSFHLSVAENIVVKGNLFVDGGTRLSNSFITTADQPGPGEP